jgi:hypothetical protein
MGRTLIYGVYWYHKHDMTVIFPDPSACVTMAYQTCNTLVADVVQGIFTAGG